MAVTAAERRAIIAETIEAMQPIIDQAVASAVSVALERARITRFLGGTVQAADADIVQVAPDDDPSVTIEATRTASTQLEGTRCLLIFSPDLRGAVYAVGTIPT